MYNVIKRIFFKSLQVKWISDIQKAYGMLMRQNPHAKCNFFLNCGLLS